MTATFEAEISKIQALKPDAVRALWSSTFKRELPKALTRDLLVRALCWHIQERVFGGHDRATLRVLESYARGRSGEAKKARYLKPGTEIVREFKGERHSVIITADGFRWRDGYYPSLTAIARTITGTSCNGPRFFGLRIGGESEPAGAAPPEGASHQKPATGRKKAGEARP